jgi:hypothetical protein
MVKLFSTPSTTPALFGGGLLGYVMYDCTHYYLHHGQPSIEVSRNLKVRAAGSCHSCVIVYILPVLITTHNILINEEVICTTRYIIKNLKKDIINLSLSTRQVRYKTYWSIGYVITYQKILPFKSTYDFFFFNEGRMIESIRLCLVVFCRNTIWIIISGSRLKALGSLHHYGTRCLEHFLHRKQLGKVDNLLQCNAASVHWLLVASFRGF